MIDGYEGAPLMVVEAEVGRPLSAGVSGGCERRMIPIIGGSVTGAYAGRVLPGGADWQSIEPDGTLEISARYLLELEEGIVEVRSDGLRHASPDVLERLSQGEIVPASQYYFRTAIRFRTGAAAIGHLNTMLAIAVGERLPDRVRLQVYGVA